jgi:hypothetical protein
MYQKYKIFVLKVIERCKDSKITPTHKEKTPIILKTGRKYSFLSKKEGSTYQHTDFFIKFAVV